MSQFRALRMHKAGKGVEPRMESLTLDDLGAGEVVIRGQYSGINFKDALAVTGAGKIMRSFPLVAGIDVAGVVESSASDAFAVGDEVLVTGCGLGEEHDGGYAERVRVPADWVIPLPKGMSAWEAMCLGTAGFTAGLALERMERNGQAPGNGPVVITGATGGVGSIAVSLFSRVGYEVAAVTGKREAEPWLVQLGASQVLDRHTVDYGSRPLETALWAGAVDNVGGETLAWLTRTTDWWGNIASIGLAGGHELRTTVMPFILRGVNLLGINSVKTPRDQRLAVWERLAGKGKPDLDAIGTRTVKLADALALFPEYLDAGVTGRTVIDLG